MQGLHWKIEENKLDEKKEEHLVERLKGLKEERDMKKRVQKYLEW